MPVPVPELKRVLNLPAVTFIAVGFMVGGGVFVFTGIVYKIAGPALPIAYALAVIPVLISMMPLAMLGSALPTTGANYRYPSRMVSPGLAFVGVWVYAWASFFGQIPLYALGCAGYARALVPSVPPTLLAIGLVTFFYIVNLLGVKPAARIQGVLVLILISALVYYAYCGTAVINPANFDRIMQKGPSNLLLGTALLTFTYFGANGIIELGDEIVNPSRVIPRAFFIAMPMVMLLYLAVAIATVGAVSPGVLQIAAEPLIQAARDLTGKAGFVFFTLGGAVLALVTTLNALFIIGTKSLLMIARDKLLPERLGQLNQRFGTPHVFLTLAWLLSVLGIVSGFSLATLASYAALGGMLIFLPVMVASIRLPRRYPEAYAKSGFKLKGFWLWFCPIVGILLMVFFSIIILLDLKSAWKIGWFMTFIASGVIYYQRRKRYLAAKGICIDEWVGEPL
ncbi:MAG: amino acid permease [Desulfobacterales bacterium]|nr:MAG: amino acid permease [Desulfobacterales bacterium]